MVLGCSLRERLCARCIITLSLVLQLLQRSIGPSGREESTIRGNSAGRMMGISQMTGEAFLGPKLPAGQTMGCEAMGIGSSVRVRATVCRKPETGFLSGAGEVGRATSRRDKVITCP